MFAAKTGVGPIDDEVPHGSDRAHAKRMGAMTTENPDNDSAMPAWANRTFIQRLAAAILSLLEADPLRFLDELQTQTRVNRSKIPPHLWMSVESLQRGFFQELAEALVAGGRGGQQSELRFLRAMSKAIVAGAIGQRPSTYPFNPRRWKLGFSFM